MNWADAERYCRKVGGFLAEIMSEEDEFLLDNFLIGGTSYWLGLTDKDTEGYCKSLYIFCNTKIVQVFIFGRKVEK